jgi:hypothetical protein
MYTVNMRSDQGPEKRTMTLNLTGQEMEALEELAQKKELSKTAVIRQAIRLYHLLDARIAQGEKLFIEDDKLNKKAEVMML